MSILWLKPAWTWFSCSLRCPLKKPPAGSPAKSPLLIVPKSVKRYSALIDQLLVMAYSIPPPTVQPTRVFERLVDAKKGTAAFGAAIEKLVLKPPNATPPVA